MFKRLRSADLKVWHLLLAVVLMGLGFGGTRAASAAFFPNGTFNMAAASSNATAYARAADGETEVLRVNFNVPSGQKADVAASFNAEAYKYPDGYCYLKFYLDRIGSTPLAPGELWVVDGYVFKGAYPTISAQGFRANIGAGGHVVIVTLRATNADCYVANRSIILTSNRHA